MKRPLFYSDFFGAKHMYTQRFFEREFFQIPGSSSSLILNLKKKKPRTGCYYKNQNTHPTLVISGGFLGFSFFLHTESKAKKREGVGEGEGREGEGSWSMSKKSWESKI